MNAWWMILSAAGLAVLTPSVIWALRPTIGAREQRVFHLINGLPDWLHWVLWPPMQLGNLVVGTVAGLLVAWWAGDLGVAVGVVAAMVLKLVVERMIRKRMAGHLAVRQRPGTSETGAILRGGDVPRSGPSFPSGHVILVAAVACTVLPAIPAGWWWLPLVLTLAVMTGRVHAGAHNPLDVTAGLGAGLLVGGFLALLAR